MKKLINCLVISVLGIFLFSTNVKALSPNAEEILDLISKDRKLNITNISVLPPSYVEGTDMDIYDLFYSDVITSYLNGLPEIKAYYAKHSDHEFNIDVFCKSSINCGISVDDNKYDLYVEEKDAFDNWMESENQEYPGYGFEHFDVSMKIEDVSKINSKANDLINSLGKKESDGLRWSYYYLYDLGYINFLYNNSYDTLEDLLYADFNKLIKYFPKIKNTYERLDLYQYMYAGNSNAGSVKNEVSTSLTKNFVSYYNNVAYNHSSSEFNFAPILLVSDSTNDSSLISTATKKIVDYIGNSKINVNIEYVSAATNKMNTDLSKFLNAALETKNINYTSNKYTLKLGAKTTDLYIVKVNDKFVNNFITSSYSLNTNIRMTTTGLDVPFDSSLKVTDVTNKYKDDKTISSAYDISIHSLYKDGYITESINGFEIMIPVGADFDSSNTNIYYIDKNGTKKEKYDYTVEKIGNQTYVVFITNHLSEYALVMESLDEGKNSVNVDETIENPKTGYIIPLISLGFIVIFAGCSLVVSKKKKKLHNI